MVNLEMEHGHSMLDDPEDYQHKVGDPKTDLSFTPNSTGYRLILNNILFPAAKKTKDLTNSLTKYLHLNTIADIF